MLRYERRWHDAANDPPIDGEARLLWNTDRNPPPTGGVPPPAAPDPDDNENEENIDETEGTNAESEQHATNTRVDTKRDLAKRKAERVLSSREAEDLKVSDVLDKANQLKQSIESQLQTFKDLKELMDAKGAPKSLHTEVDANVKIAAEHNRRIGDQLYFFDSLQITRWMNGEIAPHKFVEMFDEYCRKMKEIDELVGLPESKIAERELARGVLLDQLKLAKIDADKNAPPPASLAADNVKKLETMDPDTLWSHYNKTEKNGIVEKLSKAAGIPTLLTAVNDDVSDLSEAMEKSQITEKAEKMHRTLANMFDEVKDDHKKARSNEAESSDNQSANEALGSMLNSTWTSVHSMINNINDAAGIQWMTAYEWMDAFKEVWESVKELRKQKSRVRVSQAANSIGQVVSLIPGLGGQALTNLLQQQSEGKNNEIKEGYLKELKNNRIDLGFGDLFGVPGGKPGILSYYHQVGDTNRTQAILEFAADKGMLYGIGKYDWKSYTLPGNVPFRSLMPKEWPEEQVDAWFGNLIFRNKQGEQAQIKAGETFASGRSTFEDYTKVFKNSVNGLSLWFAKGIANEALKKVKKGWMSATLMLIVVDAWEHNALFRKYAGLEKDWWDRLAGDSKPMRIGLSKYDQGHFMKGLALGETDLEKADMNADSTDPNAKRGTQRVGPLIVAMRKYLINKDPSFKDKPEQLMEYVAKLWTMQDVKLPNGRKATYYSPALVPYHIKYDPNEMREANVEALGDDFFIERSEIIDTTAEVVQYVGTMREHGFAYPTKARYFFSHIIDTYDEMDKAAKKGGADAEEFRRAASTFQAKMRGNLDQWIARALQGQGGVKLLTEKHKDQGTRTIVLTLLQKGLISMGVIEQLAARNVSAAKDLLKQYQRSTIVDRRQEDQNGPGSSSHSPSGNLAA